MNTNELQAMHIVLNRRAVCNTGFARMLLLQCYLHVQIKFEFIGRLQCIILHIISKLKVFRVCSKLKKYVQNNYIC